MDDKDLLEVCLYAKYEVMNPGDVVFKQGDLADKCYVILKGEVSVQIPDPTGRGLVVPKKEVVKELSEDSEEEVERGPQNLTSEEIDALPLRE